MKIPENEVGEEVVPCYVGDEVGDVFTFFLWQAPLNPPVFTGNTSAPVPRNLPIFIRYQFILYTMENNHLMTHNYLNFFSYYKIHKAVGY